MDTHNEPHDDFRSNVYNKISIIELKYSHIEKELTETKQDIDRRIGHIEKMVGDIRSDQTDLRNEVNEGFKNLTNSITDLKEYALESQPEWSAREYKALATDLANKSKSNGVLIGVTISLLTLIIGSFIEILIHVPSLV